MNQENKENCYQYLDDDSPTLIKIRDKDPFIKREGLRENMSINSNSESTWSNFMVRRHTNSIKSSYYLENAYSETLIRAESQLGLAGASYKISCGTDYLGKLNSNLSGNLWTLKTPNK